MQLTLNFWNSMNFFMIWIIYLLELNSFDITYPIQMGCVCILHIKILLLYHILVEKQYGNSKVHSAAALSFNWPNMVIPT
jgi:hypothetical protein